MNIALYAIALKNQVCVAQLVTNILLMGLSDARGTPSMYPLLPTPIQKGSQSRVLIKDFLAYKSNIFFALGDKNVSI